MTEPKNILDIREAREQYLERSYDNYQRSMEAGEPGMAAYIKQEVATLLKQWELEESYDVGGGHE